MSGYSRGNPAMGDVLRSVLVLGAIVLALWFVGRLVTVTPDNPTSDADWRTAASGVEPRAGYTPLVPPELADGWRATRAELIGERWQLNVVTKDGHFVGLSQQPGDATTLEQVVEDRSEGSTADGAVRIDGRPWKVFTAGEDTTLAAVVGREAVVVTGSASRDVLQDYVASLVPFSP